MRSPMCNLHQTMTDDNVYNDTCDQNQSLTPMMVRICQYIELQATSIGSYLRITFVEWRVLLGAGLGVLLTIGLARTTTMLYSKILEEYEQKSVTLVSTIFSVKFLLQFIIGNR